MKKEAPDWLKGTQSSLQNRSLEERKIEEASKEDKERVLKQKFLEARPLAEMVYKMSQKFDDLEIEGVLSDLADYFGLETVEKKTNRLNYIGDDIETINWGGPFPSTVNDWQIHFSNSPFKKRSSEEVYYLLKDNAFGIRGEIGELREFFSGPDYDPYEGLAPQFAIELRVDEIRFWSEKYGEIFFGLDKVLNRASLQGEIDNFLSSQISKQ